MPLYTCWIYQCPPFLFLWSHFLGYIRFAWAYCDEHLTVQISLYFDYFSYGLIVPDMNVEIIPQISEEKIYLLPNTCKNMTFSGKIIVVWSILLMYVFFWGFQSEVEDFLLGILDWFSLRIRMSESRHNATPARRARSSNRAVFNST